MEEEYNKFLEYVVEQVDEDSYSIINDLVNDYLQKKNEAKSIKYMNRLKQLYKSEQAILNLYRRNK